MSSDHLHARRALPPYVDIDADGSTLRARIVGDVDSALADVLVATVENALEQARPSRLIVDVAEVLTFGAAGVSALSRLATTCDHRSIRMKVLDPPSTTLRILELFGFHEWVAPVAGPRDEQERSGAGGLISSGRFDEVVAHGVLNGRDALALTTAERHPARRSCS